MRRVNGEQEAAQKCGPTGPEQVAQNEQERHAPGGIPGEVLQVMTEPPLSEQREIQQNREVA